MANNDKKVVSTNYLILRGRYRDSLETNLYTPDIEMGDYYNQDTNPNSLSITDRFLALEAGGLPTPTTSAITDASTKYSDQNLTSTLNARDNLIEQQGIQLNQQENAISALSNNVLENASDIAKNATQIDSNYNQLNNRLDVIQSEPAIRRVTRTITGAIDGGQTIFVDVGTNWRRAIWYLRVIPAPLYPAPAVQQPWQWRVSGEFNNNRANFGIINTAPSIDVSGQNCPTVNFNGSIRFNGTISKTLRTPGYVPCDMVVYLGDGGFSGARRIVGQTEVSATGFTITSTAPPSTPDVANSRWTYDLTVEFEV